MVLLVIDGQQQELSARGQAPRKSAGLILTDIPERVDMRALYLFYLHGKIIEDQGIHPTSPKYGTYEYQQILNVFKDEGFIVISEARAKNTDAQAYALKITEQIRSLIKSGVHPNKISVVGASKGAVIAMLVSTALRNRNVNFVLLSNCNDDIRGAFQIDLWGNILSIYDRNDEFGHTCQKLFDQATGLNQHEEIELQIGSGHAILFRPLSEWVGPTIGWARRFQQR